MKTLLFLALLTTAAASPLSPPAKRGYWDGTNYVGYSKDKALNCRACPSTTCNMVSRYDRYAPVAIACQAPGQSVGGNLVWDRTSRGCFVADNRLSTGQLWIEDIPRCEDVPPPPPV